MDNIKSKLGRPHQNGKPLGQDFKSLLLSDIIEMGGDQLTGKIPYGVVNELSGKFKLARSTIYKAWNSYYRNGSLSPGKPGPQKGMYTKLDAEDTLYVEFLKSNSSTMSLQEVKDKVTENCNKTVSISTISRTITNRLESGKWSFKRTTNPSQSRFTDGNMQYIQTYLNFMAQQDPYKVKFMDEAGIELQSATTRLYGHSPVGIPAINIVKYSQQPNKTINLLAGLDGTFCTVIDGASNTERYLNFFDEAINAYTASGIPVLQGGDIIVVDNVSFHHNEGEQALRNWLAQFGISLTFQPRYSPDFNPVENCFSKIKQLLKNSKFSSIAAHSLEVAVYDTVEEISVTDLKNYYKNTCAFIF